MCSPLEQFIAEQPDMRCLNSIKAIKRYNPYLEKFKMRWHWKETILEEHELRSEDLNPKLEILGRSQKRLAIANYNLIIDQL